jgi:glycosyltransferase involved in cell wall biosynthesis
VEGEREWEKEVRHVVAIADQPGHVLERIGHSWARHARGVRHDVATSWGRTSHALVRQGSRYDAVHWLDQIRFASCGAAGCRPQVVTVHHLVESMHHTLVPRLRHADALAAVSESWKTRLEELANRPVELLPNSVDCSHFRPPSAEERGRSRAGLAGRFVAGFVGKAEADHEGRKGVDLLREVARAAAGCWPDFTLLLVGPGWDDLAAGLGAMGVSTTRHVHPRTLDTVESYRSMDALLVTSGVEGGPCVTLEAMASGVPVISSAVGHVPETIRDGESGFVCPNREVREYIAGLRALREDAALRARVAGEARAFVERTRDESVLVPKLPFSTLYGRAARRHHDRGPLERATRGLARGRLLLRHAAHRALRRRS